MSITATTDVFDQKRKDNHENKQRNQQIEIGRQAYALSSRIANADLEISATADLSGINTRIVNGTPTNAYPSVGLVGDRSRFFCSGTLIASRYVLTAAHCTDTTADTDGRFSVGGQVYSTSQVFTHQDYNPFTLDNDIAIYELNRDVTNITPSDIFRGVPRVGQTLTIVGFGGGGTGDTGHTGDFGTKRVGTTPLDGVSAKLITWNFDNNTESNTAPGDSGGPGFLNVDGELQVAGVTSGGTLQNAGIGDFSFDTRVDAFQSWIDNIVGTTGPPTGPGNPPPEPTVDDHTDLLNNDATKLPLDAGNRTKTRAVIGHRTDRDVFQVDFKQAGMTVIEANATGSLDTVLRIYNRAGILVAENDDFRRSTNARVRFLANSDSYFVSVSAFEDRGRGAFDLSVFQASARDQISASFRDALELKFGEDLNRHTTFSKIDSANDTDTYRFTATVTGRVGMSARKKTGDLNTVLKVYNERGRWVTSNNDGPNTKNANINMHVKAGQTFYVRLQSIGSSTGDYRFDLFQHGKGQPLPPARDPNISLRLSPNSGGTGSSLQSATDQKNQLVANAGKSAVGGLFSANG